MAHNLHNIIIYLLCNKYFTAKIKENISYQGIQTLLSWIYGTCELDKSLFCFHSKANLVRGGKDLAWIPPLPPVLGSDHQHGILPPIAGHCCRPLSTQDSEFTTDQVVGLALHHLCAEGSLEFLQLGNSGVSPLLTLVSL